MTSPEVIFIGVGPPGIALASALKQKVGFHDFTIFDKLDGPGGTWRLNTYPGVGCDVLTLPFSFSFSQNPKWSKELWEGAEIPEYMEHIVDKFDLRKHMQFGVECLSPTWTEAGFWEVQLRDTKTQVEYTRSATVFISAIGGISKPRDIKFPGIHDFKGEIIHTARGKRLAVIGNGASAAQLVPAIAKDAGLVKQYARSAQWYHERPNRDFKDFEKWCFKYIPLWERFLCLRLFLTSDGLVATYMPGPAAEKLRVRAEQKASRYIYSTAPHKYHKFPVPNFPLGQYLFAFWCQVPDTGVANLSASTHVASAEFSIQTIWNLYTVIIWNLPPHGIDHVDENGITSTDSERTDFDAIVLATGFDFQQFLVPMQVFGLNGRNLSEQWKESGGVQAYIGTYVHNFPNFGFLAQFSPFCLQGPSAVLGTHTQRTLIAPIVDRRISSLEVKATYENQWANILQAKLRGTVFEAGCSNWYINQHGRNSASWPGYAPSYWKETLKPQIGVFKESPKSRLWMFNTLSRWIKTTSKETYAVLTLVFAGVAWNWNSRSIKPLS